jgi:hypothetical protein
MWGVSAWVLLCCTMVGLPATTAGTDNATPKHCSKTPKPTQGNILPWVLHASEVASISVKWGCLTEDDFLKDLTAYASAQHGFGPRSVFAPISNYRVAMVARGAFLSHSSILHLPTRNGGSRCVVSVGLAQCA